MTGSLGVRSGPRPATTSRFPHQQLDQQPDDPTLRRRLIAAAVARFDHVHLKPSGISVPGARAWVLDPGVQLIGKPFTVAALAAKLREVLDAA